MSLFIGNISRNVKTRDLEDALEKYGTCTCNHKVRISEPREPAYSPKLLLRLRLPSLLSYCPSTQILTHPLLLLGFLRLCRI